MKKTLLFILSLALILPLASCGRTIDDPAGQQDPLRAPLSVRQEEPEEAEGPEEEFAPISEEMSGWLGEDGLPEDFDGTDRLYLGWGTYYLIGLDGSLVRWGNNLDNMDMGWDCGGSQPQPFALRSVLVPHAKKMVWGYRTPLVLDESGDLWGWGQSPNILLWDVDKALEEDPETEVPRRQPIKVMSQVKDMAAGLFFALAVKEDGTLWAWGAVDHEFRIEDPVLLRERVKRAAVTERIYFIDQEDNLYGYPEGIVPDRDGTPKTPVLYDTGVADIRSWSGARDLVLKTDGTLGIVNYNEANGAFSPLADGVRHLAGSGYIAEDGSFWNIRSDGGGNASVELEPDTAWAVYNTTHEEFLRIRKDGRIEAAYGGFVP